MRTRRAIFLCTAMGAALMCSLPGCSFATELPVRSERTMSASELNTRDPEIINRAFQYPKIDPARALSGEALIRALRQGGFNLYMRHTQTGTITPECTGSNLTPAGERDAKFVGASIRALRIPIDRVETSPICRASDTARLLDVGGITATRDLTNDPGPDRLDLAKARAARLSEPPAKSSNRLLVSHTHAGPNPKNWIQLDFGEIIVYQPNVVSGSEAVARIRPDDWYSLLAQEAVK